MKRHLPTLNDPPETRETAPRLDAARRRLGGRGFSEAGAGAIVHFTNPTGVGQNGVVLFVLGDELDVLIGAGTVMRVHRERVRPASADHDLTLDALASDLSVFTRLNEGARVRFTDEANRLSEGVLLEKCRYGALVARDDGRIMAVGFRKLFPLPAQATPC